MARNSEQLEALLADYVDGSLDAEQIKTVEKAIAADPQLARQLRQMKQIRGVLAGMPRATAPSDLAEDVQSQLERNILLGDSAGDSLDPDLRISRWPQIRAMAAVVALAAGLGLLVWSMLPSTNGPSASSLAIRDLPDLERPTATLRGWDERAVDASNATASRDDAVAGGAADNILPPAPPQPASTNVPVPASPVPEAAPEGAPGTNRLAAADAASPRTVWRAFRFDHDPTVAAREMAANEADAPETLVALAERNGADMLVLINTAAPLEANEAINGYFARNSVMFDRVDPAASLLAEDAPVDRAEAGDRRRERRPGGFWEFGEPVEPVQKAQALQAPQVQIVVARNLTVDQTAEIAQEIKGKQRPVELNYFARLPADEPVPDLRGVYQQRAQRQQAVPIQRPEQPIDADQPVAIDDVLLIDVPGADGVPASTRVRVGADGAVDLPGLGRVPVAGLSLEQIAELVQSRIVQAKDNVGAHRVQVRRPGLPVPARREAPAEGGASQLQLGADDAQRVDVAIAIQTTAEQADPALADDAPAGPPAMAVPPVDLPAPSAPATQPSTQPADPAR